MDPTTLIALIASCAPNVHPATMHALIRVESAANPQAVSINRPQSHARKGIELPTFRQPKSATEALRLIHILHAQGFTTSVGIAQVNTEHLAALGLQLTNLLDPCTNLTIAQQILLDCDLRFRAPDQRAPLPVVLSCFNAGNATTGIANGYVTRIHTTALNQTRSTP